MKKLATLFAVLITLGAVAKEQDVGQHITFGWTRNPEPDVVGYRLYWGTAGPRDYSHIVETPAAQVGITIPRPGLTYRFALQAISRHGLASELSEEIVYVSPIPAPPPLAFRPGFIVWPRHPWYNDVLETCTDLNLQDWRPIPVDSLSLDLESQLWLFPFKVNKDEPARFFRLKRTVNP